MVAVNVKHGVVPRTPVKLSPITGVVGVSTLCIVMTPGPKSIYPAADSTEVVVTLLLRSMMVCTVAITVS